MRCLQIWQYSGGQAERTLDAALATCTQFGFDTLLVKALDGTMWMNQVDNGPDALGSVEQVARQTQYANGHGVRFMVWVNPLQRGLMQLADMCAQLANACDGIAFDVEPYASFMGAWPPVGLCASFMRRVASQVQQPKPLIIQPDPRETHLQEIRFYDEWLPNGITHYAPQDYVTDFYVTPTHDLMAALLSRAYQIGKQYGLTVWPTLPGNCGDDTLLAGDVLAGSDGFVVWRMGTTPPHTLSFLEGIILGQPQQPVDCSAQDARISEVETYVADIADRVVLGRLRDELNRKTKSGALATPRRAVIQSVIDEAVAERTQCLHAAPPNLLGGRARQHVQHAAVGNIAEGANPH